MQLQTRLHVVCLSKEMTVFNKQNMFDILMPFHLQLEMT